ncbi:hypothetical protein I302_106745 [Kwoniella bestiolae CBS 10118]|uniref:Uncharacterized protein n=1 Tax=Kwoniella bestiolae CBS 10118 TaxID=1296100 RepID=A0A1B9G0I9_9TREE|nr:hypothetical protein I302_05990 [Kwoniella bestiolae CBS 10118]OCF24530.1 hypothetical protein I302_05990 [Kwoniella bestiolae CBS 10118]
MFSRPPSDRGSQGKILRLRGGCCTDSAFEIDQDRKYGEYGKKLRNRDETDGSGTNRKGVIHGRRGGAIAGAGAGASAGGGGGAG